MFGRLIILAKCLLLLVFCGVPAWAAFPDAGATAVRLGLYEGKTRFVLEFDRTMPYSVGLLADPMRVVIDFPAFEWRAGRLANEKGLGMVAAYRVGALKPNVMRVVLDLAVPARPAAVFTIPARDGYGPRFVLDLAKSDARQFLISASQPMTYNWDTEVADLPRRPAHNSAVTVDTAALLALAPAPARPPTQASRRSAVTNTPPPAASVLPAAPTLTPPPETVVPAPAATLPPELVAFAPPAAAQLPAIPPLPVAAPRSAGPRAEAKRVIVIDAGHGGVDPGAVGKDGVYEKTITLQMAAKLKRELERMGTYDVRLTRSTDVFVSLRERLSRARRYNADLFVSLHADIHPAGNARGLSVYTLSEDGSDKEADALAQRENRADIIAGVDLTDADTDVTAILIDFAQRGTLDRSRRLAGLLVDTVQTTDGIDLLQRPHRSAAFAVLKAPDVPSVLIEMGYLSDDKDSELLQTPQFQQRLALAISMSIDNYFLQVAHRNGG
jgi:N-acetylmuramoyl-L-alanine amidase